MKPETATAAIVMNYYTTEQGLNQNDVAAIRIIMYNYDLIQTWVTNLLEIFQIM